MIWYYIILFITSVLTAVFSWLPQVETLPVLLGVDLDAQLVLAVSTFNWFTSAFWPIGILYQGVLFMLGYFVIKMTIRFFLGHRAPA